MRIFYRVSGLYIRKVSYYMYLSLFHKTANCYLTEMVLSGHAKIRILTLWRNGNGPTSIVQMLNEDIRTTCKSVTCFIAR